MKATVVSAADSRYFHLLQGLILSLKDFPSSRELPITVLDVGLTAEQRAWLVTKGAVPRPAALEPLPPRDDGRPVLSVAQRLRPHIPALVPGYDLYLWMDADLWVQQEGIVPLYLRGGATGLIAIAPEVHVSYPSLYGPRQLQGMFKIYERLFDRRTAELLAPNPTINSGCFALKADAPHWKLWDEALTAILAKDSFYYAEQVALNYVLYGKGAEARSLFLPAMANWICHQSLPVVDAKTGKLCEPVPPFLPLGIVHLTVGAKDGEKELKVTDGKRLTRSLKYKAGKY